MRRGASAALLAAAVPLLVLRALAEPPPECESLLRSGLLEAAYECGAGRAAAGGDAAVHHGYVAALARIAAEDESVRCVDRLAFEEGDGAPADVAAAMQRCDALIRLANGDKAAEELQWAADQGHWLARAELGRVLASQGRWGAAIGQLRRTALEGAKFFAPDAHASVLVMLGIAEAAEGDVDTALLTLEEAGRAYPQTRSAPRAHRLLSGLYASRDDVERMNRHAVYAAALESEFYAPATAAAAERRREEGERRRDALEGEPVAVPTPSPRARRPEEVRAHVRDVLTSPRAPAEAAGAGDDDSTVEAAAFRERLSALLDGLPRASRRQRARVAGAMHRALADAAHAGAAPPGPEPAPAPAPAPAEGEEMATAAAAAAARQFAAFQSLVAGGHAFAGCTDAQLGLEGVAAQWARVTRPRWSRRGALILDVGANVGDFALSAARAFGLGAGEEAAWRDQGVARRLSAKCGAPAAPTLLLVEASAATAAVLRRRVTAWPADAEVVHGAAWRAGGGMATLYGGEYGDMGAGNELATLVRQGPLAEAATPLVAVDALLAERRGAFDEVDVLKVDVQGAEPQVLEGAEETLRGGKVGLVLFEHAGHWRRMEADAPTLRQVVDTLAGWGYASYLVSMRNLVRIDGTWWRDAYALHWSNVAAVPKSHPARCNLLASFNLDIEVPCSQ